MCTCVSDYKLSVLEDFKCLVSVINGSSKISGDTHQEVMNHETSLALEKSACSTRRS